MQLSSISQIQSDFKKGNISIILIMTFEVVSLRLWEDLPVLLTQKGDPFQIASDTGVTRGRNWGSLLFYGAESTWVVSRV